MMLSSLLFTPHPRGPFIPGERMRVMVRVVRVRGAIAGEVHVRHPGRVRGKGGPGKGAGEETGGGGDERRRRRAPSASRRERRPEDFRRRHRPGGLSSDALRFDRRVAAGLGVGAGRLAATFARLRSDPSCASLCPSSSLRLDALSLDCSSSERERSRGGALGTSSEKPAAPDPGRRGSDSLRVNPGVEGCADPSPETRPEAASAGRDRDETNALAGAGDADTPMPPRAPARASAASAAAAPWRPAATRCSWMSCMSSSCGYRPPPRRRRRVAPVGRRRRWRRSPPRPCFSRGAAGGDGDQFHSRAVKFGARFRRRRRRRRAAADLLPARRRLRLRAFAAAALVSVAAAPLRRNVATISVSLRATWSVCNVCAMAGSRAPSPRARGNTTPPRALRCSAARASSRLFINIDKSARIPPASRSPARDASSRRKWRRIDPRAVVARVRVFFRVATASPRVLPAARHVGIRPTRSTLAVAPPEYT